MANKIYQVLETRKWFVPAAAAQAEDAAFEVHSLASGAGRQSAQLDLGATARAQKYTWRAFVQFVATPVVGDALRVYLKTSDGTHVDNDDGTAEGAVSSEDKLLNLPFLGSLRVDEAAANIATVKSGFILIPHRHVQVVFWNGTTVALTSDVDENGFVLEPAVDQIQ